MRREIKGLVKDWYRINRNSYGYSLFVESRRNGWFLGQRIFDSPDSPRYKKLAAISRVEAIELVQTFPITDLWGDLN